MAGLTLGRLNETMTKHPDFELEGIAVEFLEAFDADTPLQEDELRDWMEAEDRRPRDVLSAVHQAIACGWVEDTSTGLCLTEDGKKKIRAVYVGTATNSAADD